MRPLIYITLLVLFTATINANPGSKAGRLLQEDTSINFDMSECVSCLKLGDFICESSVSDVYDCCSQAQIDDGTCTEGDCLLYKWDQESPLSVCSNPSACTAATSVSGGSLSASSLSVGSACHLSRSFEGDTKAAAVSVNSASNMDFEAYYYDSSAETYTRIGNPSTNCGIIINVDADDEILVVAMSDNGPGDTSVSILLCEEEACGEEEQRCGSNLFAHTSFLGLAILTVLYAFVALLME